MFNFKSQAAPAAAPAQSFAPPAGQPATYAPPPAPQGAPTPPPAPPQAAQPAQRFYVSVNGQPILMSMEEMARQNPLTPACAEGSQQWLTVAALLPPAQPAQQQQQYQPPAQQYQPPAQQYQPPAQQYQPPAQNHPAASLRPANGTVPRGLWDSVISAQVTRKGGDQITDGDYVLRLHGASFNNGQNGNYAKFQFEVLVSSYNKDDPGTHECQPVGARVGYGISQNVSYGRNFKEVLLAIKGFDQAGNPFPLDYHPTGDECDAIVDPRQLYNGALVYIEARTRPQKKDPTKEWTYVSWWPCPRNADGTPNLEKMKELL